MAATRVADVLAEVFRTYGFDTTTNAHLEGTSGREYTVDLLAEKAGLDAVIHIHQDESPADLETVASHERLVRDLGASYGLFVTTHTFTEAAHEHAARAHLILWDRADVEALIGKAVLHEVLGDPEADLPVAELLSHGRRNEPASMPESPDFVSEPAVSDPLPFFDPSALVTPSEEPAADFLDVGTLDGWAAPEPAPRRNYIIDAEEDMPLPTARAEAPRRNIMIDADEDMPRPVAPPPAPRRGVMIDAEEGLPLTAATPPAPAPKKSVIIDAESGEPIPTKRIPPPQHVEHGRGWVLTGSKVDPPPAPEKPSLAAIAAMGGPSRIPRSSGPDPRVFNPSEGALLAPAISKERAAQSVRDKIYTIDHTSLRYHPKRLYKWTVEAFVEGQVATRTMEGYRVVDLATRKVESPAQWTQSRSLREGTFDVAVDHKPLRIETEKARALALDSIVQDTARTIKVEEFDRSLDVMITMNKRVRTHRDDVRLNDEGLHWCPVWIFRGVNGEVEVDALTGEVVSQQLSTPANNTIML